MAALKSGNRSDQYLGDNPFPSFFLPESTRTWSGFLSWCQCFERGRWAFRGQRDSSWFLHSSLDRAARIEGHNYYRHEDRLTIEQRLLFRFKQQAHQYLRHLPPQDDLISWLALMQHHGAPTRFLDWTHSPFVAAYFAFEEQLTSSCAVWAIDLDWLQERCNEILQQEAQPHLPLDPVARTDALNKILTESYEEPGKPERSMVLEINAPLTDSWMTSQQGTFLCKRFQQASFSQLLMRMMIHPELVRRPIIRRLKLPRSLRIDFLKHLRQMNIHAGALFPGLEGFSRSLSLDWEISKEDLRKEAERRDATEWARTRQELANPHDGAE